MPLVCKRWYRACLGCPALWASADFVLVLDEAGVLRLERYQLWLARRAAHVRSFHFCCMGVGLPEPEAGHQAQVVLGTGQHTGLADPQ